jgi:Spy/CpxP family protein refolding chaperone
MEVLMHFASFAILGGLLAVPGLATAGYGGHDCGAQRGDRARGHGHRGGLPMIRMLLRSADLSDKQKEAAKALREELKPQFKALRKSSKALHKAGIALLSAETLDDDALEALAEARQALAASRAKLHGQGMLKAIRLLDDDQRRRAVKRMRKRHKRGRGRHTEDD